jgi:hypothetical protein
MQNVLDRAAAPGGLTVRIETGGGHRGPLDREPRLSGSSWSYWNRAWARARRCVIPA